MKIRWKLILSIVSVLVFFNLIFSLNLIEKERRLELNRLHTKIEVTNQLLKNILFAPLWDINETMIRTDLELFYRDPEIVGIHLLEINKDIEVDLSSKYIGFDAADIPHTLAIEKDNVVLGKLTVTYTTAEVEKRLSNKRKELILITVGLMIFITLAIYLISSRLLRPIDHIVARLKKVDQGDLFSALSLQTRDEFSEIERYFNRMVDALRGEMETRRAKEAELRTERDHSAEIISSTPSVVAVIGPTGVTNLINPAGERLSGYDSEELIGRNFWKTFYPGEEYGQVERLFDLFGKKEVYNHEMALTTREGELRTVSWSFIKRYDDDRTLLSIIGFGDDVTERREAERALLESEEKFRELAELLPETIFETDLSGRVNFVNRNAYKQFGYTREDFDKGVNSYDFIAAEDREKVRINSEKILGGEVMGLRERSAVKKDGTVFPAMIHSTVILREKKPVGLRGFIVDISEQKSLTAQLQQVQKMEAIGTLAGGIAHDFNNILSAILGYSQLAGIGRNLDEKTTGYLDKIQIAGNRAKELVHQILTFSRHGNQEFKPVRVEVLLKEALKLLRASLPSTIEINRVIDCEAMVMGDATQIHQIIMNLCTNAGHAMGDKGGTLDVALTARMLDAKTKARFPKLKQGPFLELTVKDTGHGMTEAVIKRKFEPFFTTKQRGEGTGMGLAVVHGIVQNHGGAIDAWNRPSGGACFKVLLPAVERRAEPERNEEGVLPRGSERILFVDDEQQLADIGKEMLESLGYTVTSETDSRAALSLFERHPEDFDLIITDMTMPGLTGDVLAERCMSLRPAVRCILCTGYSSKITKEAALEKGLSAFLVKPLNMRTIAGTIRKVLATGN